MRPGRSLVLLCLLGATAGFPAATALAQDGAAPTTVVPSDEGAGDELDGGTPLPGALPEIPEASPQTTPEGIAPDDAEALPPAASTTTTPAATTPAAGATPTPPAYLAPGPDAAVQPIAPLAQLTSPDVPLEPLRIAALIAALIAVLLVSGSALLRTLGLRTGTPPVVPVASDGAPGGSRLRGRIGTLADDVRDFLRHSR